MFSHSEPLCHSSDMLGADGRTVLPQLEGAQPGDIVWALEDPAEPELAPKVGLSASAGGTSVARAQVVRIDAEKVDSILSLVGELVVIKSQILQDEQMASLKDQRLNGLLLLLDKTVRELQETSLSIRMTSLHSALLRVDRAVRDLSGRLGKSVEIELEGQETEMDRSIVELLSDPLMHLCRNALDHGIESAEERLALGKTAHGLLKIVAARQGGRIHIDICDDGRGIDRDEVLRAAREKGVLSSDVDSSALSERAVYDLLFLPGMSTAREINDVSGRGVGLDIVRANLERVKGTVEVTSQIGRGTRFRLWIPLTTAITDAMLLDVAGDTYVLPMEVIRELVQPEPEMMCEGEDGEEVVNVRGTLLPLVRLSSALGKIDADEERTAQRVRQVIIVVEEHGTRVALMVDAVLGQSQVVVKGLGPALSTSSGVAGAAVLGDGRVGLIIDVLELLEGYRNQ